MERGTRSSSQGRLRVSLKPAAAPMSPGVTSSQGTTHVVIVMDGLKDFNTEPLEWALDHILPAGCIVTLLGAMPWLNLPLSAKTWRDVWAVEFEELFMAKERSEWKSGPKYLKLQGVIDLCKKFGVVPQKEVVMGFPLRLLMVEKITSLHATWVVFDRHQRKNSEYFAERIPCNLVMMNENGEADMIRGRPMMDQGEFTPGGESSSATSAMPTPDLIIPDNWREGLVGSIEGKKDCDLQSRFCREVESNRVLWLWSKIGSVLIK